MQMKVTATLCPEQMSNLMLRMNVVRCLNRIFEKGDYKPIAYYLTQQEIDFILRLRGKQIMTVKQRVWLERIYVRLKEYLHPDVIIKVEKTVK